MLVCLIESETNIIKPVLPTFTEHFPTEYVVHLRSRKLRPNELSMLKQKPLLCEQWCIVIHNAKFSVDVAKQLEVGNFVVWQVESRADAYKIRERYADLKIIDNGRLKQKDVIAWIQKELSNVDGREIKVGEKEAKSLCRRVDGYLDYLVQAVRILQYELSRGEYNALTPALIRKYVSKVSPVKRYHIRDILLGRGCIYSKEMISAYLARGLYDWKPLKEYLLKEIQVHKQIFESEMTGELDMLNRFDYIKSHQSLGLSDTQIRDILLAHSEISYEWLLYLESFLSEIQTDALGACRFCNFVRAVMDARGMK